MSWIDRLQPAAYISPDNVRTEFEYENVSKVRTRRTAAFDFADTDGTFVQDNGTSGYRYPMTIWFHGEDYDLQAEIFENEIGKKGVGKLEHPIYGTINVVPFGDVSRRDDLLDGANQCSISTTFFETTGNIYPTAQADPSNAVVISLDEYNSEQAQQFEEDIDLDSVSKQAIFKSLFLTTIGVTRTDTIPLVEGDADQLVQFSNIYDSITLSIDTLVEDPLTLAAQTIVFIQNPSFVIETDIENRLTVWEDLIQKIVTAPAFQPGQENDFTTDLMYASGYVSSMISSVVNNEFATRSDALNAADRILTQFDVVNDWKDIQLSNLALIDTGGAYAALQSAVSIAAGFLVEISFTLKQERSIVLNRARNFGELCAELYGELDSQYDFFINSNDLSGSEIIEIPKGRTIVYYV